MFKLIEMSEPCEWPVTVQVPQHGGRTQGQRFTALFRHLDSEEFASVAADGDRAALHAIVAGWRDIADAGGEALEFTPERLEALGKITYWRRAVLDAYGQFLTGRAAKN